MDVTAESVAAVFARRDRVVGLRFAHEPEHLRFFQARFEPMVGERIFASAPWLVERNGARARGI
jgi:tyrosine phenol-lyase